MTMPTSIPHRFMEVRFPSDFTEQYSAPLSWFPSGGLHGGNLTVNSTPGYGSYAPEWAPNDGFSNDNQLWHKQKALDRANQVAAQVRGLQHQRVNQLTHGAQRQYVGGRHECSSCYGGSAFGTGTIEGAQVLSGRGLRGGVMRTLAGRQFIESRLGSRIRELDARDAVAANERLPELQRTPLDESDKVIMSLGEHLDALNDAFTSGAIENDTVGSARSVLKNLVEIGWRIPQNMITPTLRNIEGMLNTINQVMGTVNPQYVLSGEKKKRLRTVFQVLERAYAVLQELSRKSDLSPEERRMAVGAFQGQLDSIVREQQRRIPQNREQAIKPLTPGGQMGEMYPYLPSERFLPGRTRRR